jgi:hypothetical protein
MTWLRPLLIGFAALIALSATRPAAGATAYSLVLFNNTEIPIELVNTRTGATWATLFPGKSKNVPFYDGVTMKVSGRQLHFPRVEAPHTHVRKGLFSITLRAQLNSDLKIWLLSPFEDWHAFKMPPQPAGFPLSSTR